MSPENWRESGGEHEVLRLLYGPNKNTTTYLRSNRTSHSVPKGIKNAAATLKDWLVISYEIKKYILLSHDPTVT